MNIATLTKYLTPALVTLLTVFGILMILIIICALLLIVFRKGVVAQKIIWNIKEIRNLFSNTPSYYSQKRINSFMGYYAGFSVLLCYDWLHRASINPTEIGLHVGILATLAYQITKQIQQEKRDSKNFNNDNGKLSAKRWQPGDP